jgi:hypothetical protein
MILHYFGLIHLRQALREIELQVPRSRVREAWDFAGENLGGGGSEALYSPG